MKKFAIDGVRDLCWIYAPVVLCFGSLLLSRWLTIFGVSGRVERRSIVSRSACRVGVAGEAILVLALAGRSGYVVGDESGSSEPPATPFESPGISGPSLKRWGLLKKANLGGLVS